MMRHARPGEIGLILDWAAAEGWNPGADDAAAFYAADPEGFFVAERAGAPVAAISVVNHSAGFAFLGLYLCLPGWRGQGIGYALWSHALAHAGDRTVGLNGVAAQQANYAKSGFVHAGATLRFEGALSPRPAAGIRPARSGDGAALIALDRAANGVARPRFLAAWVAPTETRQTLVLEGDRGPEGFCTIRTCGRGVKIGPIVAPDADAALRLAEAAIAERPAETAVIDVAEANAPLVAALRARGFHDSFATARMYRGPAPVPGPTLQAVATLELG